MARKFDKGKVILYDLVVMERINNLFPFFVKAPVCFEYILRWRKCCFMILKGLIFSDVLKNISAWHPVFNS